MWKTTLVEYFMVGNNCRKKREGASLLKMVHDRRNILTAK